MKFGLTFIALLFAGATLAHAAPLDAATSSATRPACLKQGPYADASCVLDAVAATTAEQHARNHQDLVRLFDWDAWNHLLLVIDFTRDRHGATQLRIADVEGGGHNLVLPIAASTWRAAVVAVRRYFRQAIDPPYKEPSPVKGTHPTCIRMDPMFERAETVLDGRVVRMHTGDAVTSDGCFDPMNRLGATLRALAVSAAPFCGTLDFSDTAQQIKVCGRLSGDRMAAAEVSNRALPFFYWYCSTTDKTADGISVFAAAATLHIDGHAVVTGAAAVAQAWMAYGCERKASFYFENVDATASGAVARGLAWTERSEAVPGGQDREFESHAAFTQTWARDADGQFRLTDWTIDAFSPEIERKAD